MTVEHDAMVCGLDFYDSCPTCRAALVEIDPECLDQEARRQERVKQFVHRHRDVIREALLDILAEDLGELVRAIVNAQRGRAKRHG